MKMDTLSIRRHSWLVIVTVLAATLGGCSKGDGYRVSGKVNFSGAPVPGGKIYFTPDSSKGNSGEPGYADIVNGSYDTSSPGGKGVAGGPMIVGIEGVDPSGQGQAAAGDTSGEQTSKSLFPLYETAVDLPKENTTKDFDVPTEAAVRKDAPDSQNVTP